MIHQLRDKKGIARKKQLVRNLFIIGLFLLVFVTGIAAWSGKLFTSTGRLLWKGQHAVEESVEGASYMVRTKTSVFKENEKLKKENTDLTISMIDYQILSKENEELKELLGRVTTPHNLILANILAKPNRSPYDTIVIDIGSDAGLTEGQRVFANANVPVGEISKVYADNSLVMLYSNPGQTTEAVVEGSNASVELTGRGGGNFEMTIPNDLPSENGTLVILPGANREVIALVDGVISKPTDPVKKVILRSPVNIQSLKWVQVKKD